MRLREHAAGVVMDTFTVHIYEDYGRLVEEGVGEIVRLDHSPGLSFQAGSDLVHHAWHLAGDGDTIELRVDDGVIFDCKGAGCPYG